MNGQDRQKNIRNFCIIAHIDHGKSTLADRLLELTKTVEMRKMKEQLLDQMDLERERGITIKLQPVQMHYDYEGVEYMLNLIDTPGHVDFHYEVSRSLAAVEGAVLLVDATKGVQAQTLANLYLAIDQGLEIIPVINKIDLPNAEVEKTKKEIIHILGCKEEEILLASGKTGRGVKEVLEQVIRVVPAPSGDESKPLRALIFDSVYNTYKGVVAYVKVVDGTVKRDDMLHMLGTEKEGVTVEVGLFHPNLVPTDILRAGDIGYIATGLKEVGHCRVGDTVTWRLRDKEKVFVERLPGYKEIKPAVYASFYPVDGDDYTLMRDALDKLKLNDAAFTFEPESNQALGRGFRCGFLGLLHLEIIQARLDREFELSPTITTPSVVYEIKLQGVEKRLPLYSPTNLPDPASIEKIYEPYVALSIVTPSEYLGNVITLTQSIRAEYKNTEYIDEERVLLSFEAPLMDVIVSFHDELKSASSGYASMNYEPIEYRASDVVKLDILVANECVEAFARMIPRRDAYGEGKRVVEKLKEVIPKQNFAVAIQAAIGGKVIARETIAAFRKDVTGGLYGGDFSRKKKLLEKQKKGKKKMRDIGKVSIPSSAFLAVLKK
ncbi:MAG: elongation factor 4 [Candidatus Moranbacteria bacterium]|nr:elongation factor 4 [Candidatus Moranbacteria bacterium]OIQ03506.1 MAG: elongation factor 4 [Candidatus Moranbacteria bacterium CG2_30_41_165]PIP25293.1 MAG: elongation factor 4 [Candidatus Moranbacteria bacterium CG23_combo_of_CG06-09_8_20_14_all_41_28]PIV86577.1 MAG: elongation factor 4 [Candidatus Moranbacteria bacterium CG17_big_fil_post_rev_8_21_14_2_50_41_107]PIW94170.1 MAG: elongation factor 4 [Candidatus Moranbacteria bacterium CG_4_8_14_3_um_filter_41_13]PIX91939.1 MAG: elongation 